MIESDGRVTRLQKTETTIASSRRSPHASSFLGMIAISLLSWGIPLGKATYLPCPEMDVNDCVTLGCEPSTCPEGFSGHDSRYCATQSAGASNSTTTATPPEWFFGAIWVCCRITLTCEEVNRSPPPPGIPSPPGPPMLPGVCHEHRETTTHFGTRITMFMETGPNS